MILGLLLLQAVAGAAAPAGAPVQGDTVTVVGRDIKRTKAALDACIRRHCPPREDIAASIAYAEDQFIAGDYQQGWVTLRRSRGRNDRFAAALPAEVSGLRQFGADMASVIGDPDMARVGTIDALSALRAGGGADAATLELKRLEVGDAFVRQSTEEAGVPLPLRSKLQMALATYDAVAARAARAGLRDLQGRAMLRGASLYAQLAAGNPMYRGEADRRLAALRASTDPAMQRYRDAALLLQARQAYDAGDRAPLERMLAQSGARSRTPVLVMAPRIDLGLADQCGGGVHYDLRDQWIDYDFVVTRDGRVAEIGERRRGKHADGPWLAQAQRSLAGRRYLPLDIAADAAGLPRLERFILVSDLAVATGSRVASACGMPTVLTMDLTATEQAGR